MTEPPSLMACEALALLAASSSSPLLHGLLHQHLSHAPHTNPVLQFAMGHKALQNAHPKKYGKGGRLCRVCGKYCGGRKRKEEEWWWMGKQRITGEMGRGAFVRSAWWSSAYRRYISTFRNHSRWRVEGTAGREARAVQCKDIYARAVKARGLCVLAF